MSINTHLLRIYFKILPLSFTNMDTFSFKKDNHYCICCKIMSYEHPDESAGRLLTSLITCYWDL